MPIVPLNERRVATEAPVVGTPNVGSAVPGAFGEDVAKAQERLGESGVRAGTTLLEHVNKMNYWDEKSKSAIYENEFSNLIDSKLHNTDTKSIQRDGQDYTIPAGYLDRNGEQARGAVADYDTEIKPLINQYTTKIKNLAVQSELMTRLASVYSTKRDVINTHEATQWRKSKIDSFEANLVNDSARAASAMSGPELQTYLDNIVTNNNSLAVFNGDSEAVRQKRQDEYLLKAVKNSVSSINEAGNPELAMKILDGFKPRTTNAIEGYTGNIDLITRPVLHNANGTISTEKSMSFEENGKEILIPTIVNGKEVSKDEAIAHYHDTGENLGKFDTVEESDAMAQKIHNRFATTFMSPSDYEKIKKDVSMNRFLIDAKGDSELAKKRISDGYYGFDVKETDTALSTLVHYKELEKKQNSELQEVRNNGAIDKMLTGQFSLKDVDRELDIPEDQGGIPRKILLKYKEGLERNIGTDLKAIVSQKTEQGRSTKSAIDAKKYMTLINSFIDDNTDKWRANEYLANAYADGIVSPQEMKVLTPLKRSLDDIKFNRSNGPLVSAIKFVKEKMGQMNAPDSEIALNVKQLLSTIGEGNPEDNAKAVVENHIKSKVPDVSTIPSTGRLYQDAYGNKARIYPDGRIEEENTTKKTEKPK